MTRRKIYLNRFAALGSAALLFPACALQAVEIANSITEFSGEQGRNGWHNGYRNYLPDETENYDPDTGFIPYGGGIDMGEWDGFGQVWTGSAWDMNTEPVAPWTYQGAEGLHPNGNNNGEEHWNIRRWVADELTATTPLALIWNTRKENASGGNGVTGILYRNGVKLGSMVIPFNNAVGFTYTNYVNAAKGDKFDLALSPAGVDGSHSDGADGSFNSLKVETALPAVPRQPDGSIFIPAGSADTDGDGLADFWENVFAPGNLATMNGGGDMDGDGKTNRQEQDLGLDPSKADTDGDGLADGVETDTGEYVSATNTGTNPKVADTDGDGRSDGDEVNGTAKSNPLVIDTDEDGYSDFAEVLTGHNPSDIDHNPGTTAIANSELGFSGTQGQNNWEHGYRAVSGDGAIVDYAVTEFVPFPGGDGLGDWDGATQVWTGSIWDLNTAPSSPWTELGPFNVHPSGVSPLHWVIRRWTAAEVTQVTPMALRYHVHKTSASCGGNGVTAGIFVNGELEDSVAIGGTDVVGVTRTVYANITPNDKVDLILSPRGADGGNADGCDGSAFRLVIDPTLPENPRQPDGSLFIPANASDSDGDGIPDAWELVHGSDLTIFSRNGDFDNDGLSDLGEYGRDTNPKAGDTDSDTLGDLVETGTGVYVSATDTGSNPKAADTDGDGLGDASEVNGTIKTNPNKSDSDDDGFTDQAELAAGTNPNSNADNPLTFVIANSQAEFSGIQGQNGWFHGYRNFTMDGAETYDHATHFVTFEGGPEAGDWDGFSQVWTGSIWDLNTTASGPWTELGPINLHPNGDNSAPNEEHWVIRRWVASELTQTTPVAIIWNVRKNNAAGDGVTGLLYLNGELVDSRTVPGSDTTGQTRSYFVDLKPGDTIDLAVTPQGVSNRGDGSDGSASWFWVDTRLPREPRQPNGRLFIPAGSPDTDADGLIDFWERVYAFDLTTLTGTGDNDSDSLNNTAEQTRDTNPTAADTDGDGLNDNVETDTGTFVNASNTGSNPRQNDSDNDGLSDQAEVVVHGTNPNKTDTDEDTFSDAAEVASGHNPNDANSNPSTSVIADSRLEFSGVQGQDNWFYGYRNQTADGGGNNYSDAQFIQFAGGSDSELPHDGIEQFWSGTQWDLNTSGNPWTEIGMENSHPNGPSPVQWSVRRWVANELTSAQPLAIRYHVRKSAAGGSGVTGAIYINGEEADSIAIAGNNTTGATRTYYATVQPGDKIDLVHKSVGPTGDTGDGVDGSMLWMQIDTVLPANPTQPDGTPFNPGGGASIEIVSITMAGGQPTIRWESETGATYTIQASSTLLPGSWTNLKTGHASEGAQTSYTDTTAATASQRFYRIVR